MEDARTHGEYVDRFAGRSGETQVAPFDQRGASASSSEQQSGSRNAIPVLDQIPGLGDAFGHQDNATKRTELIIFIRPQIIRNGSDAHLVAEELRSKLRGNIATTTTNAPVTTSFH